MAPDPEPAGAAGASFSVAQGREVLDELRRRLGGAAGAPPELGALSTSLHTFSAQLDSLESLLLQQEALVREGGLPPARSDADAPAPLAPSAVSAGADADDQASDPHAAASTLPDVFSLTDDLLDRERVRALAWLANCPPEAVRKELRAFQKTVSDRISLAVRRVSSKQPQHGQQHALPPPPPLPPAAVAAKVAAAAAAAAAASGAAARAAAAAAPTGLDWSVDAHLFCMDAAEEAARRTQLAKLQSLLVPDAGGISGAPVSVVGVFQQLMAAAADWRLRRALLEAMGRSSMDVLWRLLQHSRVLDCLAVWLQEALTDHQCTLLRLLLDTLTMLPMRRDLLKGSRLEVSLDALAAGLPLAPQRGGGGGGASASASASAAADDAGSQGAALRRRFSGAAAAVLAEWRKDPDPATVLRRAGTAAAPLLPAAAADAHAAPAAPARSLASRLLGTAAGDGLRKRTLAGSGRPTVDARGSPRPRVQEAPLGVAANGGADAAAAASPAAAAAAPPVVAAAGAAGGVGLPLGAGGMRKPPLQVPSGPRRVADMTAKLGERGGGDGDVVLGFRSRVGDGSVRRSQLATARPVRPAGAAPLAAPPRPGVALRHEQLPQQPGLPVASAAAAARQPGDVDLAAAIYAQRQAEAMVLGLQAEARRQWDVAAAERQFAERAEAHTALRAAWLDAERQRFESSDTRAALAAMRASLPWEGPPPELLVPADPPPGMGEESEERFERDHARAQTAKVFYPSPDAVPDSPAEPAQPHAPAPSVPLPMPWLPSLEAEDGLQDWWRQNLQTWEAGVRLADYVLPPALLHKHLGLPPDVLPPQYAAPAPPPLAMLRQLQSNMHGAAPLPPPSSGVQPRQSAAAAFSGMHLPPDQALGGGAAAAGLGHEPGAAPLRPASAVATGAAAAAAAADALHPASVQAAAAAAAQRALAQYLLQQVRRKAEPAAARVAAMAVQPPAAAQQPALLLHPLPPPPPVPLQPSYSYERPYDQPQHQPQHPHQQHSQHYDAGQWGRPMARSPAAASPYPAYPQQHQQQQHHGTQAYLYPQAPPAPPMQPGHTPMHSAAPHSRPSAPYSLAGGRPQQNNRR